MEPRIEPRMIILAIACEKSHVFLTFAFAFVRFIYIIAQFQLLPQFVNIITKNRLSTYELTRRFLLLPIPTAIPQFSQERLKGSKVILLIIQKR